MTNYEKWMLDNLKTFSDRDKFKMLCTHYDKCVGCPLENEDSEYCKDIDKFKEWANKEINHVV